MNASIGLADSVTPAGTWGRLTGFRTHREAPFRLSAARAAVGLAARVERVKGAQRTIRGNTRRRPDDTFPHLQRVLLNPIPLPNGRGSELMVVALNSRAVRRSGRT